MPRQVLGQNAAVAVVGLILTAQQAGAIEQLPRHHLFHLACPDQPEVAGPELLPVLLFAGEVDQVLGRRQLRQMQVLDATNRPEKELQVVLLRETCELGDVVEPDVDDSLDTGSSQKPEELFGGLLCEPDG